MLVNYFCTSSILSIQQKKKLKSHDRKNLLNSKFSGKSKKWFTRNFSMSRWTSKTHWKKTTIFSFFLIYIRLVSRETCWISWQSGGFNHFKYFENHETYVNETFLHNTARSQIFIRGCKVFAGFSRFLPASKLMVIILKARKLQFLSIFLPRYSKKWTAQWNQMPSPPSAPAPLFSLSHVNALKMFILKHWLFWKDIWNFSKWKSLIIDNKCWMLWKALLKEC